MFPGPLSSRSQNGIIRTRGVLRNVCEGLWGGSRTRGLGATSAGHACRGETEGNSKEEAWAVGTRLEESLGQADGESSS